jgi:hypothetical protein
MAGMSSLGDGGDEDDDDGCGGGDNPKHLAQQPIVSVGLGVCSPSYDALLDDVQTPRLDGDA